jgi:hypothetical protein
MACGSGHVEEKGSGKHHGRVLRAVPMAVFEKKTVDTGEKRAPHLIKR